MRSRAITTAWSPAGAWTKSTGSDLLFSTRPLRPTSPNLRGHSSHHLCEKGKLICHSTEQILIEQYLKLWLKKMWDLAEFVIVWQQTNSNQFSTNPSWSNQNLKEWSLVSIHWIKYSKLTSNYVKYLIF